MSELADRAAIAELIYRYCRSVDRLDVPLGHSIWHDDGVADYGAEFYQGSGKGVIDLICAQHLHTLGHSHQVTNILYHLDGDKAGTEAYCTATLRARQGEKLLLMTIWTRYVDSWSRRGGRWGLDKRIAIRDFDEMREATAIAEHDVGKRDQTDPSYTVLPAAHYTKG
jgi:hypothetical protein